MAITRAQQVKQMLREGGRIEFRFGGRKGDTGQASQKESKASKASEDRGPDNEPNPGDTNTFNPETGREGTSGADRRDQQKVKQTQSRNDDPFPSQPFITPPSLLEGPGLSPFDQDEDINEQIRRSNFINSPSKPMLTPFPLVNTGITALNTLLTPTQKYTKKFYYDNVMGRTVTLPDGTVITFDEDNYSGIGPDGKGLTYDQLRKAGVIDAYGGTELSQNTIDARGGPGFEPSYDGGDDGGDDGDGDDGDGGNGGNNNTNTGGLAIRFRKDGGRINAMDGGMMSPEGGIMDLETGRQMYFLGKLVKKAGRALKKITKSPLGKAAILGGALYFGGGGGLPKLLGGKGLGGFSAKTFFSKANPLLFSGDKLSMGKLAGLSALSPFLFQQEEEEDDELYRGPGLDIRKIRENPYDFLGPNFANGGRIGLKDGNGVADEEAENAKFVKRVRELMDEGFDMGEAVKEAMKEGYAEGGRIGLKGGTGSKILNFLKPFSGDTKGSKQLEGLLYGSEGIGEILRLLSSSGMFAEGGDVEPVAKKTMPLLDMDGKEMDLRAEGGFVPIGRMEKADDVPARLSKNEFVFTADAVRNAGEGDVDKGAEVMYNMMKNLESGGEVSEESQGLEGARRMFQTSKRLEEVL
jgi:hypothetical protein